MNFTIFKNGEKELSDQYATIVAEKIIRLGSNATIFDKTKDKSKQLDNSDMIISIGGDGTIIKAHKTTQGWNVPILGFNLGRLGFLADLEKTELNRLDLIVKGEYKIEKRMLLEAYCTIDGKKYTQSAVNDVVISKDSFSKMIDLDVLVDGKHYVSYRADGIIISTPTGSTAYSMSAGGPITDPLIECILLTPICPLSMRTQTTIFNKNCKIEIIAKCRKTSKSVLMIDGTEPLLNGNETVTIKKSENYFKLVKFNDKSFYETVNKKLWNGKI